MESGEGGGKLGRRTHDGVRCLHESDAHFLHGQLFVWHARDVALDAETPGSAAAASIPYVAKASGMSLTACPPCFGVFFFNVL